MNSLCDVIDDEMRDVSGAKYCKVVVIAGLGYYQCLLNYRDK